jgi:hypothetical protein
MKFSIKITVTVNSVISHQLQLWKHSAVVSSTNSRYQMLFQIIHINYVGKNCTNNRTAANRWHSEIFAITTNPQKNHLTLTHKLLLWISISLNLLFKLSNWLMQSISIKDQSITQINNECPSISKNQSVTNSSIHVDWCPPTANFLGTHNFANQSRVVETSLGKVRNVWKNSHSN